MPKDTDLASTKFIGKISSMGDKLIIVIPKDFHKSVEKMKGKQVRVVVDDEF
jgi:hypothetical protein